MHFEGSYQKLADMAVSEVQFGFVVNTKKEKFAKTNFRAVQGKIKFLINDKNMLFSKQKRWL